MKSFADLRSVFSDRGDAPAVVGAAARWGFDELSQRVRVRAAELTSRHATEAVAPGSIATFTMRADPPGIVELLALWEVGAIVAPLNPRLTEPEREAARQSLAGARVPRGTGAVVWTSGTGGRPRGVALSFDNLAAITRASADRLALADDEVWLAGLSPAHVGGLVSIVRSLSLGGTLVALGDLDTQKLSDALDGHGTRALLDRAPTQVSLVPTQLLRLLDHRDSASSPPDLRCALIGGAHAPADLVRRAQVAGWPLALTYGATEMSSQIATASPELARRKPGTVGAPLPGVECEVDADGGIRARGPTRALGYVGIDSGRLADEDGWYRTGDLGRIDDEGHLWITGRRIDRIVSGGVTIDAVEVEEALRAHPAVSDACVVGVPDVEWGERVAVWIEPVVGECDVDEIETWLHERITSAKCPRLWRVGDALPRNANGKVDRPRVRSAFA